MLTGLMLFYTIVSSSFGGDFSKKQRQNVQFPFILIINLSKFIHIPQKPFY
jgi:hypothetical protein